LRELHTGLQITLQAEAANVALVRHAIAGLAESAGMDPEVIDDLKTVVTEACMNVVVHAYPEGGGLIRVEAVPKADSLVVTVSDTGSGFQPRVDVAGSDSSLGIGFSLIAVLCSSFQISGARSKGTTVTMTLPLSRSPKQVMDPEPAPQSVGVPGEVRIVAARPELLPTVLPRAVSAFGSQRDLSVDQISDAGRRDLGRGAGELRRR